MKEPLIDNEVAPANGLAPEAIESVRIALSRILASKLFLGSERLRRFLQFIVDQTLLGRTAGIKEYALAVEVFDKEASFDPRVDPVVRVEAGRLRSKLREYYEVEGQSDPVRIDLPKGTYVRVFRFICLVEAPRPKETIMSRTLVDAGSVETSLSVSSSALQELKEQSDFSARAAGGTVRSARHLWMWAAAAIGVVAIAGAAWLLRRPARRPTPVPEVIPLTSYPGAERSPNFSPDGNQVAFSWNGERQDNFDIYVKLIGSSSRLRLTTDPADDISPAFSPDGRSIGFIRVWKERAAFIIIPSIGGFERVVADIAVPMSLSGMRVFSWLPDGKWVVIEGLALLSTETGEKRPLTSPASKSSPDYSPAVSPNGRTVAFARGPGDSSIYLLDLTQDLEPKGDPRRLSFVAGNSHVPTWTPDGKEIVFASGTLVGNNLWRMRVSGGEEPELLSFSKGGEPDCPTISRSGNRLAYQQNGSSGSHIWRLSLLGPRKASPPTSFISSTQTDGAPQFSPDGKKIVFASGRSSRSGDCEIWVCDSNGSSTAQLTWLRTQSGSPHWSPDGKRIAFDSWVEGRWEVYVISANGGRPHRLTDNPASDDAPSWSRDGEWIYFHSNRSGEHQVWKMPSNGGDAVQVTTKGGYSGFESSDGKWFYYAKGLDATSLWKVPMQGGEETQVVESLSNCNNFAVLDKGIYWIPRPDSAGGTAIEFLDLASGKSKPVAMLTRPGYGLAVSPDGRWLLYSLVEDQGSDIMLEENFR